MRILPALLLVVSAGALGVGRVFAGVLLPSPDLDESVETLNARSEFELLRDLEPDVNEHFIKRHSNRDLAKFVIYTDRKTPEETCDEILRLVTSQSGSD